MLLRKYPVIYENLKANLLNCLDLTHTQTTDKFLKLLCPLIGKASNLRQIILKDNRISDNGVMSLCNVLKKTQVELLDLSKNRISPASFKFFRTLKSEGSNLKFLVIGQNDIPQGVLKKKALQLFKLGVKLST